MILAAVQMERAAVARALGMKRPQLGTPSHATVSGFSVSLHVVGIGAVSLPDLRATCPQWVILAGFGGALDPRLQIGDVVIEGWPGEAPLPLNCRPGRVHTADRIISTPECKAELFRSTGASVVDMETAAVRSWAQQHGLQLIIVRAISDRADQGLDPAVLRLIDPWGRPRPLRIASALLARPSLLPHLVRLGRCSRRAGRCLGEAVNAAFKSLLPGEDDKVRR